MNQRYYSDEIDLILDGLIDARHPIRSLCRTTKTSTEQPLLAWKRAWEASDGSGITVGLVDGPFLTSHPDLIGADLSSKIFVRGQDMHGQSLMHGTHAVTSLVGQGRHRIRGIAPGIRLLVAVVVSADNVAADQDVADSLEWLCSAGAKLVAITLGDSVGCSSIRSKLDLATKQGCIVLAAAGNVYPQPLLFPARESAVIAVGAADESGSLASSCCRLPRLDLVAPGIRIPAPIAANTIQCCSGSSVACVLAVATAALALSLAPLSSFGNKRTGLLNVLTERYTPPMETRRQTAATYTNLKGNYADNNTSVKES